MRRKLLLPKEGDSKRTFRAEGPLKVRGRSGFSGVPANTGFTPRRWDRAQPPGAVVEYLVRA